jgi:sec-independent protein translocase protein TatB
MFDIGPSEILLICVIALIVVGPERLPGAVKTAGMWIGRFRRSFYKIKSEIERELNADEIKRQLYNESVLAELDEAKTQLTDTAKDTEETVKNIVNSKDLDPGFSDALKASQSADEALADEIKAAADSVEKVAKQSDPPSDNSEPVSASETRVEDDNTDPKE